MSVFKFITSVVITELYSTLFFTGVGNSFATPETALYLEFIQLLSMGGIRRM